MIRCCICSRLVGSVIDSHHKVLYLLAACQKYEMASVQSSVRAEVNRGTFPTSKGAEAFTAYAIASAKGLIPEMKEVARQTLDHPMTFEILGEGLRLFEGWALRDLVGFRRCCRDNLVTCLDVYLKVEPPGPSRIWVGCPEVMPTSTRTSSWDLLQALKAPSLPKWLNQLLSRWQNDLKVQSFTHPLDILSKIHGEYHTAFQTHVDCKFCSGVYIKDGPTYCAELVNKLAQARDKVTHSLHLPITMKFTSRRHVVIVALISD